MSTEPSQRHPVEQLAEEFLERVRRGEKPQLQEYVQAHPHFAEQIQELFPALALLEQGMAREPRPARNVPVHARLGHYRILREAGRGGMGVVYEAEQETLGRHVALKVLPALSNADPDRLERFRREARSAARLHHTNIVPVFEVGEHEGTHYYAMQFIEGQPLDRVLEEVARLRKQDVRPQMSKASEDGKPVSQAACLAQTLVMGGSNRGQDNRIDAPALVDDRSGSPTRQRGEAIPGFPLADASGFLHDQADSRLSLRERTHFREAKVDMGRSERNAIESHDSTRPPEAPSSELSSDSNTRYYHTVARIGMQVADALVYAHAQQIVHRDIKPANLLLDGKGTVWLTDFGLAKEEGSELTRAGDVVGTLRYMAPERFNGVSDPRGDIYSLGLTLYEFLALRPAFDESDRAQLLKRMATEEPPSPRSLDSRVPRDLETIVLKAASKEPAQRYQEAGDLADDLRRFLADRPIRARRTSWREHAWRWCRRNPGWAATLAIVFALLLVMSAGGGILSWNLRQALAKSQAAERDLNIALDKTQKAERDKTEKLRESYILQARAERVSGRMGQRYDALKAIRNAASIRISKELQDEATAALILPDVEVAREWDGYAEGTVALAFDANYERYVRVDNQGALTICRCGAEGGEEILARLPPHGAPSYKSLFMSPDGKFVLSGHNGAAQDVSGAFRLWRLDPSPALLLDKAIGVYIRGADFSPNGKFVAVGGWHDGKVHIYDLELGEQTHQIPCGGSPLHVAFHPHEARLAVAVANLVKIFDVEEGRELPSLVHAASVSHLSWHPDGKRLATGCQYKIHHWDTTTAQELAPAWTGHTSEGIVVQFNQAGDRLFSSDWSRTPRVWDANGQALLKASELFILQPSPDERYLGWGIDGTRLRVFRIALGRELQALRRKNAGELEQIFDPVVHSEGHTLAVCSRRSMTLFNLETGEDLATVLLPHDEAARPIRFDAVDGLLTGGRSGLLVWPAQRDAHLLGLLRIGPPREVASVPPRYCDGTRTSHDGNVLAVPADEGAIVVHRDSGLQLRLVPQHDTRWCAVSPDGRLVVTCSHWSNGRNKSIRVWNAQTGEHVHDFPFEESSRAEFSPDGRRLMTHSSSTRLWEVGTWRELHRLKPSTSVFNPDGTLVAVNDAEVGTIRLVETETAKEIARLTGPEPINYQPACFTPDGTRLAAVSSTYKAILVWDLRRIRQGLKELDLDWNWPEFPEPLPPKGPPARIIIDAGSLAPQ